MVPSSVRNWIAVNAKIQRQQYETDPNSFFTISDHIENLTPQFSEKDGEDENQEADRFNWDYIRDKSRASLSMSGARVLCFVVLIDSPFIRVIRAILLTADSEGLFELTRTPWPVALKKFDGRRVSVLIYDRPSST